MEWRQPDQLCSILDIADYKGSSPANISPQHLAAAGYMHHLYSYPYPNRTCNFHFGVEVLPGDIPGLKIVRPCDPSHPYYHMKSFDLSYGTVSVGRLSLINLKNAVEEIFI